MPDKLRISMIAPNREKCGVADYSRYLLHELRDLVDVVFVTDAANFNREMNAVDIVHIQHQYFLFGGVAPWKNWFPRFIRTVSAPAVMTVHELVTPAGNPARKSATELSNRRQFLQPALRGLIVHTDLDRKRLVDVGIQSQRIEVIRHGVPPGPEMPSVQAARRTLGLAGQFVMTMFGFISRRKGYETAIGALKHLPKDVVLLVAGGKHPDDNSDFTESLMQMATPYGDRVRFTGYLSDLEVTDVMSATDVVLAPFIESSGSGSLAMALACGKPIVASPIEPHLEVEKECPGVLVFPETVDPSGFAEAIMSLRGNTERLAIQSAKSLGYARTHSYRRMAEETFNLYHRVLAEIKP